MVDWNTAPKYELTLKDGTRYTLAESGAVLDRSDGPRGWNYSGKWIILGFSKRAHSRRVISLQSAMGGEDVGQGWVHDLDHGTHRMWGSPTGHRFSSLRVLA